MPRNEIQTSECAPWQPQAAEVLETYMRMMNLKSMREMEDVTGLDRNKLGMIMNCRPEVSVNFWKRVLTNLIVMALHGYGRDPLSLLESESRRMDQVKYKLTPAVKKYVADSSRLTEQLYFLIFFS